MEKFLAYQSFRVSYTDSGVGEVVLLVHGFGEDRSVWNAQVAVLSKEYRVIAPNLPGTGNSMPQGDDSTAAMLQGPPASIEEMAEVIYVISQQEKIEQFILLGHSMGGYISLAFAEKYPQYLQAFGLIHSTAFADSDEKKSTRRKAIDFINKNGGYAFMQTAVPGLFIENFQREQPEQVEKLVALFNPADNNKAIIDAGLVAYYEAMIKRPDRTAVLQSLKVPVLFIMGPEDKAVPMADSLKQVTLPEISEVHIITGTAHMSMLEAPDVLNGHLLGFLKNVTVLEAI